MTKWYVATMNDCIFIVDRQPHPSTDYPRFDGDDDMMVISMRSGSREAQQIAEQVVNAHNQGE